MPDHKITESFGLIDVHLIRTAIIYPTDQEVKNDSLIEQVVSLLIKELCEIMKCRADALGANCVVNLKIDVSKVQCKTQKDTSRKVFVLISAIGDAVKI